MTDETLRVLRHIFDARIDNVTNINSYLAWTSARDIVEYALADNLECLAQYDYLETKEEQKQWALYTKCPFLPGRVVKYLIIKKVLTSFIIYVILYTESEGNKMRTLNEEIARIKSEVAEIASKAFTGKSIKQRVNEAFTTITPQEYEASEQVWDDLYRERVRLREELQKVDLQIQAVEKIIGRPIKTS